ncbi:hypothetical protein [Gemmiger formicilis]|jgi:hypothetical protein|uniref:hypothetical protein n=1 Tax=Gemmiger formicilis TaxID=745368 RepID=UPI003CCB3700
MRTNTRVEFGLYDVTARGDSAPSCTTAKPFCNLGRDLLLESVPSQNKYGTLESEQWLMDGSFSFFPEVPEQYFWGLWSTTQSDKNGVFADPPVLDITFTQDHSSSGLTLHFYIPTDDWASRIKIQWFSQDGGLISTALFYPDAVDYYCAKKVENYRRIRIHFLETNRPGRYLKLAGIDYGVYLHFSGHEIVEAHVLEECDPLSSEISINTLNVSLYNKEGRFSILNPEGYFDVLQHKQKFTVWEDVKQDARSTGSVSYCMGTFYLSDWSNSGDTLADFSAVDAIGLLDGAPFDGGIYDTTAAELAEAILTGYSYTLDGSLAAERVQGYIAAGTRRGALQQLAFAIGAVVDCSRGELIRIAPAPSKASGMITYDRKLQDGSKVTLNPLITAVAVTAHRYLPGEATEELYRDTLDPGIYRVTFNAPAVVDSLTVTGAELTESGVNLCTLTVAKAGEVCVTGRKYTDSTVVLRRTAANLPPNAQDNELTVTDATLVGPSRAEAVAVRVLEHYAQRYEQNFSMVAGDEKLADRLIIQSFGGEMVRGVLTKLEFDLTGGFLADAKVIGRRLTSNAAAYAGEIHAGERSLI